MAILLPDIQIELSALQYELMGYPNLRSGQSLSLILDGGVLLPDLAADSWFTVQKEALTPHFVHIGPARYAFAGQIRAAELLAEEGEQFAVLLVACGDAPLRITCAPLDDGRLPFGTWETRYVTGLCRVQGVVEEEFTTSLGEQVGVTIGEVARLVLTPGDPHFGEWHTAGELPPTPYRYDRIFLQARLHRQIL